MMLGRKERILAEEDGEWMTLETETEFLTKDNLRFTVRVAALISILVAILGSVWLVMRVIWKQGKEEFIENPVKVGNTPGRLSESYAQQEE
jgi:flagellar biogenesis protein FliO